MSLVGRKCISREALLCSSARSDALSTCLPARKLKPSSEPTTGPVRTPSSRSPKGGAAMGFPVSTPGPRGALGGLPGRSSGLSWITAEGRGAEATGQMCKGDSRAPEGPLLAQSVHVSCPQKQVRTVHAKGQLPGKRMRTQWLRLVTGAGPWAPLPGVCPNARLPDGKQGVSIHPTVCSV